MDPEENEAEAIAEEVAEAVAAPVAEAIAGAAEALEEAEETAEAIAAAAMESARGQRIELVETELAACRMDISNLERLIADLPTMLGAETVALLEPLNGRLGALEAVLASPIVEAPNTLTPPPLAVEIPAVVETPAEIPATPEPAVEAAQERPRKRFQSV